MLKQPLQCAALAVTAPDIAKQCLAKLIAAGTIMTNATLDLCYTISPATRIDKLVPCWLLHAQ